MASYIVFYPLIFFFLHLGNRGLGPGIGQWHFVYFAHQAGTQKVSPVLLQETSTHTQL